MGTNTVKWANLYKIANELLLKPSTGKVVKTPFCCRLRPSSHHPEEIWKWSLFLLLEIVHTNPSRKRNFSKTFFQLEEFENKGFAFSCEWKTFWNQSFPKTMESRWCDFLARVSYHNSKMTGFFALFKFLRWSVLRKHLMRFRSETFMWTGCYCHLNGA